MHGAGRDRPPRPSCWRRRRKSTCSSGSWTAGTRPAASFSRAAVWMRLHGSPSAPGTKIRTRCSRLTASLPRSPWRIPSIPFRWSPDIRRYCSQPSLTRVLSTPGYNDGIRQGCASVSGTGMKARPTARRSTTSDGMAARGCACTLPVPERCRRTDATQQALRAVRTPPCTGDISRSIIRGRRSSSPTPKPAPRSSGSDRRTGDASTGAPNGCRRATGSSSACATDTWWRG